MSIHELTPIELPFADTLERDTRIKARLQYADSQLEVAAWTEAEAASLEPQIKLYDQDIDEPLMPILRPDTAQLETTDLVAEFDRIAGLKDSITRDAAARSLLSVINTIVDPVTRDQCFNKLARASSNNDDIRQLCCFDSSANFEFPHDTSYRDEALEPLPTYTSETAIEPIDEQPVLTDIALDYNREEDAPVPAQRRLLSDEQPEAYHYWQQRVITTSQLVDTPDFAAALDTLYADAEATDDTRISTEVYDLLSKAFSKHLSVRWELFKGAEGLSIDVVEVAAASPEIDTPDRKTEPALAPEPAAETIEAGSLAIEPEATSNETLTHARQETSNTKLTTMLYACGELISEYADAHQDVSAKALIAHIYRDNPRLKTDRNFKLAFRLAQKRFCESPEAFLENFKNIPDEKVGLALVIRISPTVAEFRAKYRYPRAVSEA